MTFKKLNGKKRRPENKIYILLLTVFHITLNNRQRLGVFIKFIKSCSLILSKLVHVKNCGPDSSFNWEVTISISESTPAAAATATATHKHPDRTSYITISSPCRQTQLCTRSVQTNQHLFSEREVGQLIYMYIYSENLIIRIVWEWIKSWN